jgi:hypothetical protein
MIIPSSSFDYSSMVLQSNKNYVEADGGCELPATSAIASTDSAVEPNLMQQKALLSLDPVMQQSFLQDTPVSSSYEAFGWGDFPLLQQSMVMVVPSDCVSDCSRPTFNLPSEQSLSSMYSFDTISSVGSLVSLCSTEVSSEDSPKSQRRVQFAKVQIREYALTLGDHPWCESGFPLSLDWKFAAQHDVNIDDFEHERMSECDRSPRRLDVWERRNLLRRVSGYTTSELNGMERCRMLQQQRESVMFSGNNETELAELEATCSPSSKLLRHSASLQNLSSACV